MRYVTILLALLVGGCLQREAPVSKPEARKPTSVTQQAPGLPTEPQQTPKIESERPEEVKQPWRLEQEQLWENRNAALADGRIHMGMTFEEFLRVWRLSTLTKDGPEMSQVQFAGHNVWRLDFADPTQHRLPGHNHRHVILVFYNGILHSWHDF